MCTVIRIELLYQTLMCEVFCLAAASPDEELLRDPAESSIGLADAQVDTSSRSFESRFLGVAALGVLRGDGLRTFSWKKSCMFQLTLFLAKSVARDQVAHSQLVPAICFCPAVWSVLRFILGEWLWRADLEFCPSWDFHQSSVIPRRPSLREFLRFLFTPRVILILVIIIAMGFCEGIMSLGDGLADLDCFIDVWWGLRRWSQRGAVMCRVCFAHGGF